MSVAKSIRISEDLYDYINNYQGEGFNQKFSNIIRDARDTEPARRQKIQALDAEIKRKSDFVKNLDEDLRAIKRSLSVNGYW